MTSLPPTVFDLDNYARLNAAREALLRSTVPELQRSLGLATAADIGCGSGYFSALLGKMGFRVVALDGRPENVAEARRRNPEIDFRVGDVEDDTVRNLGAIDLVLCLGLLYHLENPFRGIRNLYAITGKILLIESVFLPGDDPVLTLRDESPDEDQGLRHVAFYPTEPGLVKMLFRAGFSGVYRFHPLPDHEHFRSTPASRRVRTMLVASRIRLAFPFLTLLSEPSTPPDPWKTAWGRATEPVGRLARFLRLSWPEKRIALRKRQG